MARLTRKVISEAIQSAPIESILLGASSKGERQLTAKQVKFAEAIAMGESKAGAYRKAYRTSGKPKTQSNEGQKLAASPAIAAQIDALRLAAEARKYATPAALRSLVIERLTAHAIDEDVKPAQRLRALELLGKVTEVAAFTERREIVRSTGSGDARARLLGILRQAINVDAIDVDSRDVRAMDAEASGAVQSMSDAHDARELDADGPPLRDSRADANATGTPQNRSEATDLPLLSIPHPRSQLFSASTQKTSSDDFLGKNAEIDREGGENSHCVPYTVTMSNEINDLQENFVPIDKNEGVSPSEDVLEPVDNSMGNTPLDDEKA